MGGPILLTEKRISTGNRGAGKCQLAGLFSKLGVFAAAVVACATLEQYLQAKLGAPGSIGAGTKPCITYLARHKLLWRVQCDLQVAMACQIS
eukprot:1155211-Pelagomonas_calceolata.AAC.2